MCSIVEDDFGDDGGAHVMTEEIQQNDEFPINEICKKCNLEQIVVKLNNKEAQCKECFLTYVRHKFRASLGSTKIVRRSSNVLVLFDGSAESVVLLDMLKYALSGETFKRLHFNTSVVYVDEMFLFDFTEEERLEKFAEVKKCLNEFGFKTFYSSISGTGDVTEIEESSFDDKSDAAFLKVLKSFKSLTQRQDFISQHKNNLLRKIAQKIDYNFVFLSEIGPDLAKTLLTQISLGRGSSSYLELAFCDDRTSDVKLIRPIRDLNENEIKNYLKLNNLSSVSLKSYGEDDGEFNSIQNLTARFVNGLQTNFPSTVSTIFRTGDKMTFKSNDSVDSKCSFCKTDVDFNGSQTLFAIEFSRLVSANCGSKDNQLSKTIAEKALSNLNGDESALKKQLCHGCRNIFVEGNPPDEIKQFLL